MQIPTVEWICRNLTTVIKMFVLILIWLALWSISSRIMKNIFCRFLLIFWFRGLKQVKTILSYWKFVFFFPGSFNNLSMSGEKRELVIFCVIYEPHSFRLVIISWVQGGDERPYFRIPLRLDNYIKLATMSQVLFTYQYSVCHSFSRNEND